MGRGLFIHDRGRALGLLAGAGLMLLTAGGGAQEIPRIAMPQRFIENRGQVADPVRFLVRGAHGSVFFTPAEVVFSFERKESQTVPPGEEPAFPGPGARAEPPLVSRLAFRYRFEGGDPEPAVAGQQELPGRINVMVGAREEWTSGVPVFEEILYRNVYAGIDLRYFFANGSLRTAVLLHEGADPERVRFAYEGIDGLALDPAGGLIVRTAFGDFHEPLPELLRATPGDSSPVAAEFEIRNGNTIGVRLQADDLEAGDRP